MGVAALVSFAVSAFTSIASYYLSTKSTEGARLGSLDAPTSSYGQQIPNIYGRTRVPGNLIWTQKIREEEIEGNKKKGIPTEYRYYGTFAVLLCYGVTDVSKIWLNSKLVYDRYSPSGETQVGSSKISEYLKIYRGTEDQLPDPTIQSIEGIDRTPGFKGKCYLVFNNLPLIDFNNGIPTVSCEVRESENPLLSTIVTDICKKAGISEFQIDTSELNEIVSGFIIENNGTSYREVLEQLAKIYLFFVTENKEGKLLFRKIKRPITSLTISLGELATRDFGNEKQDNYKRIILQKSELPSSLSVNFRNPNLRYNNDSQVVLTRKSDDPNNISVDVNISLFRTEARYIAMILIAQFWIRRNRYEEINLPPKWLNAILPGDVISIPLNENSNILVQVENVNIGANYQLNLKCVEYEGGSFNPPPVSVEEEIRYDFINDPSSYGSADLILLDIPIFDNRNKESGAYAIASTPISTWSKGQLFGSFDNGNSYTAINNISKFSAVGICSEILSSKRTDVIDEISELTITLVNSNNSYQLFSSTDISFLNGDVLALIGNEIIAFKNANLISEKTFKISYLLRGLFGTSTENHVSNEQFVLLKGGTAATNVFFPIDVGQNGLFKLRTPTENIDNVPIVNFTYQGNLHIPYTPINITSINVDDSIRISWFRRTNYQNEVGYSFEVQLKTIGGIIKTQFATTETYFDYSYSELTYYFPNEESFVVKLREINSFKNSSWVEAVITINLPYLASDNEEFILDEDSNFILY